MIVHSIETKARVALGQIDLLRMHAAEVYVAPTIGELFDCRFWRGQAGSTFFGQWADVERAHAMLAVIRSAMEQEFADFIARAGADAEPRVLAGSFSRGMGQRVRERLEWRKAGYLVRAAAALTWAVRRVLRAKPCRRLPLNSALAYSEGSCAGDRVDLRAPWRASRLMEGFG